VSPKRFGSTIMTPGMAVLTTSITVPGPESRPVVERDSGGSR
jgi:hypothetical protein